MDDARVAVETGVDGLYAQTSPIKQPQSCTDFSPIAMLLLEPLLFSENTVMVSHGVQECRFVYTTLLTSNLRL